MLTRRTETVLVDGYNVIHRWRHFRQLAHEPLDVLRRRLLAMMENWSALEERRVVLVFDGQREELVPRGSGNVRVLFSPRGFTADAVIEQYMTRRQRHTLTVTSDRACAAICSMRGCPVMSSEAFEQLILERLESVWRKDSENAGGRLGDRVRKDALLALLESLKDERERHRREKLLAEMERLRAERQEKRTRDREATEELRRSKEADRIRREDDEALRQFHALYGDHRIKRKKREDGEVPPPVVVDEDFDWTAGIDDSFRRLKPNKR